MCTPVSNSWDVPFSIDVILLIVNILAWFTTSALCCISNSIWTRSLDYLIS
jgi:hypothetical protein